MITVLFGIIFAILLMMIVIAVIIGGPIAIVLCAIFAPFMVIDAIVLRVLFDRKNKKKDEEKK